MITRRDIIIMGYSMVSNMTSALIGHMFSKITASIKSHRY